MLDPKTRRIRISRDVSNDGNPTEIPNYNKNNSRNMKSIPPPIRYDGVEKKINQNALENPTMNNVAEVVLVGGTDESYKSPVCFNDAWYNKNYELRAK